MDEGSKERERSQHGQDDDLVSPKDGAEVQQGLHVEVVLQGRVSLFAETVDVLDDARIPRVVGINQACFLKELVAHGITRWSWVERFSGRPNIS